MLLAVTSSGKIPLLRYRSCVSLMNRALHASFALALRVITLAYPKGEGWAVKVGPHGV